MKKIYKVMTMTAIVGVLFSGTSFHVSAADFSSSKLVMNDIAATNKTKSVAKSSATQDGITLTVTEAKYDGNILSLSLKRSGKKFTTGITERAFDEKGEVYAAVNGAIESIIATVNGKSTRQGNLHDSPSLIWNGTQDDPDTVMLRLVDPSWLGGSGAAFKDKNNVTFEISLGGQKEPLFINTVINNTSKAKLIKPNITKKYNSTSTTLNKLNATSESIRVQLSQKNTKGEFSNIRYDLVDNKGQVIEVNYELGITSPSNDDTLTTDLIFTGLSKDTKSITLRGFTTEMEETGAKTGGYKLDKNGKVIKNYIKELQFKVNLK